VKAFGVSKNKGDDKMKNMVIAQVVVLSIALAVWGGNLVRLIKCDWKPSYKAEIIYALGVVTPTCVVTVWMDIEKEND